MERLSLQEVKGPGVVGLLGLPFVKKMESIFRTKEEEEESYRFKALGAGGFWGMIFFFKDLVGRGGKKRTIHDPSMVGHAGDWLVEPIFF